MAKNSLIIDITRSDGCGSDILSVADELTAGNLPGDAEIPEGKAAEWMNLQEFEQGSGSKIKMDYVPLFYPIEGGKAPLEVIYDDPTMDKIWGDTEDASSEAGKFFAEHKEDIVEVEADADYKLLYYKMPKPFVSGEVICKDGECAKDVKVKLTCKKCGTTFDATTDFFGDFEFTGLYQDAEYLLEIEGAAPVEFKLDKAKNLGTIQLA